MKRWVLGMALLQLCSLTQARDYGHYDVLTVIAASEAEPGKPSATINVKYLNQILDDLESHAGLWPPQFDSADDRHRAERDVTVLSDRLNIIAEQFAHSPPMLLRVGALNNIGNNLDIQGCFEKAEAAFTKLLEQTPDDPQANYRFGVFYAGTVKKRANAIPYLEKAKALGVPKAEYWLGLTYSTLGEKAKAIENLKGYTMRVPTDTNAAKTLDAVQNGRIEMKQVAPPGNGP